MLNGNGSFKKFRHTATKIDYCGSSKVTSLLSRSYQDHIKYLQSVLLVLTCQKQSLAAVLENRCS